MCVCIYIYDNWYISMIIDTDVTMRDICHCTLSKLIDCTALRVNTKVNYGLWVTMM